MRVRACLCLCVCACGFVHVCVHLRARAINCLCIQRYLHCIAHVLVFYNYFTVVSLNQGSTLRIDFWQMC